MQWIQQSNLPCDQAVQVCGFSAGKQDNWLITQLISRTSADGTRLPRVSVLIEYEQLRCNVDIMNCPEISTFNTLVYETSVDSAAAIDTRNYRQVQRNPDNITSRSGTARVNETITIDFSTDNMFFYFAIQDVSTCIEVSRMIVFHTV